jgi:hypothetical protein
MTNRARPNLSNHVAARNRSYRFWIPARFALMPCAALTDEKDF